ncbi:DUF4235 domain-containing protein [Micrococcoides hystricis]|uniref:DUF4235 domain-containing protein n=1 Tax=Micrococcoides hystricis TaxID=1572761 RepID=A0ABV6PCW8_9MICC
MNIALKLVAAGLSIGAAIIGPRIADGAWRLVARDEPPTDLDDTERSFAAVVGFAALSAFVVAVLQVASKRGAYRVSQKMIGDRVSDREV